jgi:hypothetical protein
MPLTPAMRPAPSIRSAAERPIKAPPIAAASGVKFSIGPILALRRRPTRCAAALPPTCFFMSVRDA